MNGRIVVGVGNIYANEALFRAGIHPLRAAGRDPARAIRAARRAIRDVLNDALEEGGTTLRNYVDGDGEPGYFRQSLNVYERAAQTVQALRQEPIRAAFGPTRDLLLPDLSALTIGRLEPSRGRDRARQCRGRCRALSPSATPSRRGSTAPDNTRRSP